jgi:hypothetical protein
LNQVAQAHQVEYISDGDFKLDGKWRFETGSKSKTVKQLKTPQDAYVVSDQLEIGSGKRIPGYVLIINIIFVACKQNKRF